MDCTRLKGYPWMTDDIPLKVTCVQAAMYDHVLVKQPSHFSVNNGYIICNEFHTSTCLFPESKDRTLKEHIFGNIYALYIGSTICIKRGYVKLIIWPLRNETAINESQK